MATDEDGSFEDVTKNARDLFSETEDMIRRAQALMASDDLGPDEEEVVEPAEPEETPLDSGEVDVDAVEVDVSTLPVTPAEIVSPPKGRKLSEGTMEADREVGQVLGGAQEVKPEGSLNSLASDLAASKPHSPSLSSQLMRRHSPALNEDEIQTVRSKTEFSLTDSDSPSRIPKPSAPATVKTPGSAGKTTSAAAATLNKRAIRGGASVSPVRTISPAKSKILTAKATAVTHSAPSSRSGSRERSTDQERSESISSASRVSLKPQLPRFNVKKTPEKGGVDDSPAKPSPKPPLPQFKVKRGERADSEEPTKPEPKPPVPRFAVKKTSTGTRNSRSASPNVKGDDDGTGRRRSASNPVRESPEKATPPASRIPKTRIPTPKTARPSPKQNTPPATARPTTAPSSLERGRGIEKKASPTSKTPLSESVARLTKRSTPSRLPEKKYTPPVGKPRVYAGIMTIPSNENMDTEDPEVVQIYQRAQEGEVIGRSGLEKLLSKDPSLSLIYNETKSLRDRHRRKEQEMEVYLNRRGGENGKGMALILLGDGDMEKDRAEEMIRLKTAVAQLSADKMHLEQELAEAKVHQAGSRIIDDESVEENAIISRKSTLDFPNGNGAVDPNSEIDITDILKTKVSLLQSEITRKDSQILELTTPMTEKRISMSFNDDDLKEKFAVLEAKHKTVVAELTQLRLSHSEHSESDEIIYLKEELKVQHAQVQRLTEENKQLSEKAVATEDVEWLRSKNEELRSQLAKKTREFEQESDKSALEKELDRVKGELAEKKEALEHMEVLQTELKVAHREVQKMQVLQEELAEKSRVLESVENRQKNEEKDIELKLVRQQEELAVLNELREQEANLHASELKEMQDEHASELKELKDEQVSAAAVVAELDGENERLKAELQESNGKYMTLAESMTGLETSVSKLEEELKEMTQRLSTEKSQRMSMQTTLEKVEEEKKSLEQRLSVAESSAPLATEQTDTPATPSTPHTPLERGMSLTEKRQSMNKLVLADKLREMESETATLRGEVDQWQEDYDTMKKKLTTEVGEKEGEIKTLKDEVDSLKQVIEIKSETEKAASNLKAELESATKTKEKLKQDVEMLRAVIDVKTDKEKKLQAEADNLKEEVAAAAIREEKLIKDNEELIGLMGKGGSAAGSRAPSRSSAAPGGDEFDELEAF